MRHLNPVCHLPNGVSILTLKYKGLALDCLINTEDYLLVGSHWWRATKARHTFYAQTVAYKRDGTETSISMHRLLIPDAAEVDHADHNGLNNKRDNIRPSTASQNHSNINIKRGLSSRFIGVCWDKTNRKFLSSIRINGRKKTLGRFDSEEEAARVRDKAAKEHHKEFAVLNFKD